MQLVLKAEFKPQKEMYDILTKLQEVYSPEKYSTDPSKYIKDIISRSLDKPPFLSEELVTVKVTWEDVEAHRTSIDVKIKPVVGEAGKVTLQLFPSKGTINMYYDDPIGQLLGFEIISELCKVYHLDKAVDTRNEMKKTIEGLRKLATRLTLQRQKALNIIAELLVQKEKICKDEALKRAMQLVGIPILPIQEDESLEEAKKKLEDAYKSSRKAK